MQVPFISAQKNWSLGDSKIVVDSVSASQGATSVSRIALSCVEGLNFLNGTGCFRSGIRS